MIKENIEKLINEQINFEVYSAYIYRAMGAYCDSIDLSGFASWFRVQAKEEEAHGEKFYNYLVERGGRPFFTEIPAPQKDWDSLISAFEDAYKHEQIVTERINKIMTLSLNESDHATSSFLNWFVDEQVEEEATFDSTIKQLKLIDGSGHGLFMMDKELKTRAFVAPVQN
jgi:ferritin